MKNAPRYNFLIANKELEILLVKQGQLIFNLDKNNNREKVKKYLQECTEHLQVMLDNIDTMSDIEDVN